MSDSYDSMISRTMNSINDYTGDWIVHFYKKLATGILPVVGITAALMIALLAYKHHQRLSGQLAKEVMSKFIMLALIVSLLRNWAMIDLFFVKTWISMSDSIASSIFGATTGNTGGIADQIQRAFNDSFSLANKYIATGSIMNIAPIIAGIITMFFMIGTLTVLTLEIITSKLMMLIIIALLPLFLLCLLFDSTKGIFDRVIGQLTGNALVVIFVSMAGAMSITLLNKVINSDVDPSSFQGAGSIILIGSVSFALIMKAARVAHGIGTSVCLAGHGSGGMGEMRGHLAGVGVAASMASNPAKRATSGAMSGLSAGLSKAGGAAMSKFRGK